MIFNVPGHIEMIRNGIKTQTRRVNRGVYQVGRDYAVQQKRGVKAENDIRIGIDDIWKEDLLNCVGAYSGQPLDPYISTEDARAEGGYYPITFEELFRAVNPKWDQITRWAYMFHAIEGYK
jgi:hypothetical protein